MKREILKLKIAERLIILNDRGAGLLARFYYLINKFENESGRPSWFNDKNVDNILKTIAKKFPNIDAKSIGSTWVSENVRPIIEDLKEYMDMFEDLLIFRDHVIELFDKMEKTRLCLTLRGNTDLSKGFLNLASSFMQLVLLMNKMESRKAIVGMYFVAHTTANNKTDNTLSRVINKLIQPYQCPYTLLFEEFHRYGKFFQTALNDACDIYNTRNVDIDSWLQKHKAFLGIASAEPQQVFHSSELETDLEHIDLISLEQLEIWIVYGYLMFPDLLLNPSQASATAAPSNASNVWPEILKRNLVLPLYRNFALGTNCFVTIFVDAFKQNMKKFSDAKNWQQNTLNAYHDIMDFHRKRRSYLRSALKELALILADQPGMFGLKILDVFKAMSLTRDEICWYLRHICFLQEAKKLKQPFEIKQHHERSLPEMLGCLIDLWSLVEKYQPVLQKHYLMYLADADAPKLDSLVTNFKRAVPEEESEIFSAILKKLRDLKDPANAADQTFQDVRLDWFRVQGYTSSDASSDLKLFDGSSNNLVNLLNRITYHSRFVDDCHPFMLEVCNLSFLAFYQELLNHHLYDCAFVVPLQIRFSTAFAQVCEHFLYATHPLCPEERHFYGKIAINTTHNIIKLVCQRLVRAVIEMCESECVADEKMLPRQCVEKAAQYVLAHTKMKTSKGKLKGDNAPGAAAGVPPPDAAAGVQQRSAQVPVTPEYTRFVHVTEFCNALMRCQQLEVWGYKFYPLQTFQEMLELQLAKSLVDMTLYNADQKVIAKPSELLCSVRAVVSVLQTLENHMGINITSVLNNALPQQSLLLDSSGKVTITRQYGDYLTQVLLPKAFGKQAVYSPVRQCFVTVANDQTMSGTFEEYTDTTELQALVEIVGPLGMRYICQQIVDVAEPIIHGLFSVVAREVKQLKEVRSKFTDPEAMRLQAQRLVSADQVVESFVNIGLLLHLRNLCLSAVNAVLQKRAPFIMGIIDEVSEHMRSGRALETDALNMVLAAGKSADVDPMLLQLVRKLRSADPKMYEICSLLFVYLAVAVPRMITNDRSNFINHLGAHANNLHCISRAVNSLIPVIFDHVGPNEPEQRMQEFVALLSSCLLRLNIAADKEKDRDQLRLNRDSLWLLMSQIVDDSTFITMEQFEDCFPYALIRGSYHAIISSDKSIHFSLA